MKSLIVPVAIILGLIAFFAIIDRKDFNRYDNIQSAQTGRNALDNLQYIDYQHIREMGGVTTEITPAESKTGIAAEAKPAENKPVAEPVFAESKFNSTAIMSSGSVAEPKPTEDKPTETKLVAGTQSEGKLLPAAVPVVTPEEAEKLNEDAKAYALTEKEKREPFYKLYQETQLDSVCFQGTIRATSTIPDPKKNDYDNCLYALFIEIDSLISDIPPDKKIACEVIVNAPIMKSKVILQNNKFFPGDKVWCTCAEYDTMPQAIQEIQLSDDIQSYEHEQYYPLEIKKISAFQKDGYRNFAKREITLLPIQTLPKDEKATSLRKERIQNEIVRIEEEIKKHGGSFEKWNEEYKSIGDKYKKLCQEEWKGWIENSYCAAGGEETQKYNTKTFIDSVLLYKDYLEKNNIDLIILRIPSKWDFAARVLGADDFQENPAWIEHYYECLKNDIEIVDPMPEMYKAFSSFPLFYYYHIANELHPCEGMSFIAAKCLSSVLNRYPYNKNDDIIELRDQKITGSEPRNHYPSGNELFDPTDLMVCKTAVIDGKMPVIAKPNTDSPFLCISNSLFSFPSRVLGASIPAYISFFLKTVPDHVYQAGQDNSMLRTIVSQSSILSHRKAVIMGEGFFMWGGFPPFPKYLLDNVSTISLQKTLDLSSNDVTIKDGEKFDILHSNGGLIIKEGNPQDMIIQTTLPYFKDKKTCLVRIIFEKYDTTYISIHDATDDSIIEPSCGVDYNLKRIDFFVPIKDNPRTIDIHLRFSGNADHLTSNVREISKIELWYY